MQTLIVDDELINRRLLVKMLKAYGHCDTARDGAGALEMVRDAVEQNSPYDLIFLDIKMPKINGKEVLQAIRHLERQHQIDPAKVVMATAFDDPKTIIEAFDQLCDGFLSKPIERSKLDTLLQDLFPDLP